MLPLRSAPGASEHRAVMAHHGRGAGLGYNLRVTTCSFCDSPPTRIFWRPDGTFPSCCTPAERPVALLARPRGPLHARRHETRRRSAHMAAGTMREGVTLRVYEPAGIEGGARLREALGPARVPIAQHHAARQAGARPRPRSHHSHQQRRMRGACCEDPQPDGGAARCTAAGGLGCALWARALLPGRSGPRCGLAGTRGGRFRRIYCIPSRRRAGGLRGEK